MKRAFCFTVLLVAAPLLTGCSEDTGSEAAPLPPRPVLTMVVARHVVADEGFSGRIAPRFETTLAFRTLGRLISRDVDVGDQVEKGQPLAAIDAETLAADLRSAKAQLANARIQARTAGASAQRTRTLFSDKTVSQSDLDVAEQSRQVADAELASARAQLDKTENALSFAVLTAPYDGVITDREADVGQVVSAGAAVFKLARTGEREAVVDVPAAQGSALTAGDRFRVVLQIEPDLSVEGGIREIAPQAEALTRTNRVRITLADPPPAFRIGALVKAIPQEKAEQPASVIVPKSAILEEDGKASVWVVDETAKTVTRRAVTVSDAPDGAVRIDDGLKPDERVVIAGVHSLEDGQAISLTDMAEGERPS
ncbi:efflux RND transporter periplasmic adaptor subunit [Aurantimonas sp. C2-6-R+9]|uniref:efflux RND transporter periplasmic adaptor subunit n=1 Tax=unclassified Aurantimonas TaxID=2638230 RepID=UPI002E18EDD5|nr:MULTISPECIES: efflux RND transporter periplasmic adaptor subunit [unclassified Aurantimonas]MEC5291814.1 efflux RND transporter periplasmic adaptor subunit [Aurantimonas sp. C2-3-R2]MEC5382397.1 efflux RND transporter periplasmic adaptor subunit [Aurantimonas sp. C2-6-R+9]MEC5412899.1 efflux RND transporter periplasmic adaptor subunit [Aurantimonas sp. C2-4-R8]